MPRLLIVMKPIVERPPRRWAEPQVPIQALGDRFGRKIDGAAGAGKTDVDNLDLADGTLLDQPAGLTELVRRPLLQTGLEHAAVATCGVDHGPSLAKGQRHRFLAIDVLARFSRQDR